MNKKNVREIIDKLTNAEHAYYVLNDPIMSDGEYDKLFNSLKLIEQDHPELLMEDSPTDGSGAPIRVLMEDGHLLENEDSRDNIAQTSKETLVMLYTTKTEVDAQEMITQLQIAHDINKDTGREDGAVHFKIFTKKQSNP